MSWVVQAVGRCRGRAAEGRARRAVGGAAVAALKPCLDCGALSQSSRCPTHARTKERARNASRTPRGNRYGAQHRAERAEWAPYVAEGVVRCRRAPSGQCVMVSPLIAPGAPWHLGHPDEECPAPKGPEHEQCNTAAAGRAAHVERSEA